MRRGWDTVELGGGLEDADADGVLLDVGLAVHAFGPDGWVDVAAAD